MTTTMPGAITLDDYETQARSWLDAELPARAAQEHEPNYAIFHNRTHDEERALIDAARAWQARRVDAGFGAITWGPDWGGPGLTAGHERVYVNLERGYQTPERHEKLPDSLRVGAEGDGWKVALTTLGFERNSSAGIVSAGGNSVDLARLVDRLGLSDDPLVRQRLGDAAIYERAAALMVARYAERERAGAVPGVEGSIGKLVWTQNLKRVGDAAASFLGDRFVADTGEPDTFAWSEHLLGAPGYRIAGGSDEIQRNIIGERGLGLPR